MMVTKIIMTVSRRSNTIITLRQETQCMELRVLPVLLEYMTRAYSSTHQGTVESFLPAANRDVVRRAVSQGTVFVGKTASGTHDIAMEICLTTDGENHACHAAWIGGNPPKHNRDN